MKHFALFLLLSITSLSQVAAQRKWELGVTVRGGTYTKATDQTELLYDTYLQRKSNSRGMSTSLGLYAQRRLGRGLSLSTGLAYSLNQYETQQNLKQIVYEPLADQTWRINVVEQSISVPVQLDFSWSRWSLSAGPTLSYHLNSRVQSSYTDLLSVSSASLISWCGTGMFWIPEGASNFQVFGSGALEYSFNGSTRLGVSALMSFKKNEMTYNYTYLNSFSKWSSDSRLSMLPRSWAVSLRHKLLK